MSPFMQMLILALLVGFVAYRFFSVLGRRVGSERPEKPQPKLDTTAPDEGPRERPFNAQEAKLAPGAGSGIAVLQDSDPSFDPAHFLQGAKAAYEMIVQAFADADRARLRQLLAPAILAAYEKALDEREATGAAPPELVQLKSAEIAQAGVIDGMARVAVTFEAMLGHGPNGMRDARERWTFERPVRTNDPNWRLSGVAAA